MLIIGQADTIINTFNYLDKDQNVIVNMSSALQGYPIFDKLFPIINIDPESKEFDMLYMNYLLSDQAAFNQIMTIIYSLYSGINVLLMIGTSDTKYLIAESLLKFIQQRYGYNGYIINNVDDLSMLNEQSFTLQGLYNLDIDKEKYAPVLYEMQESYNIGDNVYE